MLTIEQWPIERLRPYAGNPRKSGEDTKRENDGRTLAELKAGGASDVPRKETGGAA